MNTIYILIIIAITLVTNASLSFAMPFMKSKINAFISATKRKLNTPKPVDCVALEQRIKELEKKITKRESNYRQAIRQEITSILIELKNK
jgi:hypothetical protein